MARTTSAADGMSVIRLALSPAGIGKYLRVAPLGGTLEDVPMLHTGTRSSRMTSKFFATSSGKP
jgi:hypothetical protein